MDSLPASLWIAACAHQLQQQWHTIDPLELEEVARDLWRDERLRALPPDEAAVDWLKPITELPDFEAEAHAKAASPSALASPRSKP